MHSFLLNTNLREIDYVCNKNICHKNLHYFLKVIDFFHSRPTHVKIEAEEKLQNCTHSRFEFSALFSSMSEIDEYIFGISVLNEKNFLIDFNRMI